MSGASLLSIFSACPEHRMAERQASGMQGLAGECRNRIRRIGRACLGTALPVRRISNDRMADVGKVHAD